MTAPALLRDIRQDVRVACRGLGRSAGVSLAATLVLACGIGVSVAIFSVADVVLRRPLPVHAEDRLVALWGDAPGSIRTVPLTPAHFERYRQEARAFAGVAGSVGLDAWPQAIRDGDRTFRAGLSPVSGNFFGVLGSHAQRGRLLGEADDRLGAPPVGVISDALWRGMFGGDPAALGRRIGLGNGRVLTIVGVAPAGLDYPSGTEVWVPFAVFTAPEVIPIARLRPGVSANAAAAELRASFAREASDRTKTLGATAAAFRSVVVGDLAPTLRLLTAGAALLLLTGCLNAGSMLLMRAAAREHEIAVRRALGASRSRVVRQLVFDGAPIAIAAAGLGVWWGAQLLHVLLAMAPAGTPRIDEIRLQGVPVLLAMTVACVAALGASLLPVAWFARDVADSLQTTSRTATSTRRVLRPQRAFVVLQMALAVVVLFAAGLLGRSLRQLQAIPTGLAPDRVAVVELSWPHEAFSVPERVQALYDRLLPSLTALPDVRSAAPVNVVPFTGATGGWDGRFVAEERPAESPMLNLAVVGRDYFQAAGLRLRRGRAFQAGDRQDAALVAVVSERVARLLWPAEDPVGKRIRFADAGSAWRTVVGVAAETRYRALRDVAPTVYLPMEQFPDVLPLINTLVVRTRSTPASAAPSIRHAVLQTDPDVAVLEVSGLRELIGRQLSTPRLTALLASVFGAGALLLVGAGLYAALGAMVRARQRELAIRQAIGATPRQLRAIVLAQSLAMGAAGVSVGLLLALAASRLLRGVLYDVPATDPVTAVGVLAVLAGVTLVASYVPARRATQADSLVLLRQE